MAANFVTSVSRLLIAGLWLMPYFSVAQNQQTSHWREAPPLPYRIQEIYPTKFANHIIVAGGLGPDTGIQGIGVSDRVIMFNLATNQWYEGAKLPEPRHHAMLVTVNGRLLAFGGFVRDNQGMWHNSTDVLELILDGPATAETLKQGVWKKIAQMPVPLAETLTAVNNGLVHFVSGRSPKSKSKNSQWSDQIDVRSHYIFDSNTLRWSKGPSLPTARNSACSVTLNGDMHTIAGRTVATGNLAVHEAYNFSNKQWRTLAPLPDAQGGLACGVASDRIYVFGGEFFNDGGGVYSEVWEYNVAQDAWRSVSKMPKPRHGLGAITVNESIYVIGGALQAGGKQTSNRMSVFSNSQQKPTSSR